jgi:2,4-dienoyl-CoA reductase-like NADH-dependent reductase (Old Yellow Enzyme family)
VSDSSWPRVASLKTPDAFRRHLSRSGIDLPFDDVLAPSGSSPLAEPLEVEGARVGNRFCILPMEGWDGTTEGEASDLTQRRWRNFGRSGAKLIWGGEAVAVREDGRANPNQLVIREATLSSLEGLRHTLVTEHKDRFGGQADADLYVGLQLTHSGRFARPNARAEPLVAYAHPVLDRRFTGGTRALADSDMGRLVEDFVTAARRAAEIGFRFVDVKQFHGYLGHEVL